MNIVIEQTLETSFSIKGEKSEGGKDLVNHTASKGYRAYIRKSGPNDNTSFADISEATIACDYRLPIVNRTTWTSRDSNYSLPFAVCRSKDITRSPTAGNVFDIICTFETGPVETEQCVRQAPQKPEDIEPEVSVEIGSYDRVIYQDKDGQACWRLPGTNTPFQNPVVETIPTLTLIITQFENQLDTDTILERSFKVNSDTYRGKDPGMWMIGAVKVTDQDVTLSDNSVVTWSKVTYPLMLSERYYYEPCVDAQDPETEKVYYGHKTAQPLVDSFKVENPGGDIVPMTDPNSGNVTTGYIYGTDSPPSYVAGQERTAAFGGDCDRPDYLLFRTQDETQFTYTVDEDTEEVTGFLRA